MCEGKERSHRRKNAKKEQWKFDAFGWLSHVARIGMNEIYDGNNYR